MACFAHSHSKTSKMVSRVEPWGKRDRSLIHKRTNERREASDALAMLSIHAQNSVLFPNESYLEQVYGTSLGPITRAAVIRWMFKTAKESLVPLPREVAGLAANYFDRVMGVIVVRFAALQALGAACLHLAAKISHGGAFKPPSLKGAPLDVRFELPILQALRWRLIVPTVFSFVPLLANEFWIPLDFVPRAAQQAELLITRKNASVENCYTYSSR